jgi:hypothetical protein
MQPDQTVRASEDILVTLFEFMAMVKELLQSPAFAALGLTSEDCRLEPGKL